MRALNGSIRSDRYRTSLTVIAIAYLCGTAAGIIWGSGYTAGGGETSIMMVMLESLKWPTAAFLLGFTSLGVPAIPSLCIWRAYCGAAQVYQATASGKTVSEILGAVGLCGSLCAICLIILSVQGLVSAGGMLSANLGRRRDAVPIAATPVYIIRFVICAMLICAAAVFDMTLLPGIAERFI